jgi:centromeric protein E
MSQVQVAIRVKPDDECIWQCSDTDISHPILGTGFSFDRVFPMETLTEQVYSSIARQIIHESLRGINGTIFAYGQTSSGKTWTMQGSKKSPGIIPLSILDIFDYIDEVR